MKFKFFIFLSCTILILSGCAPQIPDEEVRAKSVFDFIMDGSEDEVFNPFIIEELSIESFDEATQTSLVSYKVKTKIGHDNFRDWFREGLATFYNGSAFRDLDGRTRQLLNESTDNMEERLTTMFGQNFKEGDSVDRLRIAFWDGLTVTKLEEQE